MYCRKCGTQNPDGTADCSQCGAPMRVDRAREMAERGGVPAANNSLLDPNPNFMLRHIPLIVFIVVCLFLCVVTGMVSSFFSMRLLTNVFLQASMLGFMAVGMSMVVMTGKVDLSVASVATVTGILYMYTLNSGQSWIVAVLLTLIVAAVIGLLHGIISCLLGVPAVLLTLGTASLLRGIAYACTGGMPLTPLSDSGGSPWGFFWTIPSPFLALLVVALAAQIILSIPSVGSFFARFYERRELAAPVVPRGSPAIVVFVVCSVMAAISGMILVARLGSAMPTTNVGQEISALSAVVIGGLCITGGKGTIIGPLLAAVALAAFRTMLNLVGVMSFYQIIIEGIIFVLALILSVVIDRFLIGNKKEAGSQF